MTQRIYAFSGQKLAEYSDFDDFKTLLSQNDIDTDAGTIQGIFEELVEHEPEKRFLLNKLYFEHVFYGQLKNIFYHKIKNLNPSKEAFIQNARSIIKRMNKKESIPLQYHDIFTENGFYAMDFLDIENSGNVFLLGYDYLEKGNKITLARFLIVQVVRRDEEPIYHLASLEINYAESLYLLMVRNLQGIDAVPTDPGLLEENKWDRTMTKFITKINKQIIQPLGIDLNFEFKKDREGMYCMCKDLDDGLLQEYRDDLNQHLGNLLETSINQWFSTLIDKMNQPSQEQKNSLKNKISSQMLALFLKNNPQINLVAKARELGQIGYTTRIEFKANRAGKGATKSRSGSAPIATEDMFHSLYIDFKDALELPKWSVAWFTDAVNDYLQTTFHITKNNFKIVFLPGRHLNKESIYNVVRYVSKYRDY